MGPSLKDEPWGLGALMSCGVSSDLLSQHYWSQRWGPENKPSRQMDGPKLSPSFIFTEVLAGPLTVDTPGTFCFIVLSAFLFKDSIKIDTALPPKAEVKTSFFPPRFKILPSLLYLQPFGTVQIRAVFLFYFQLFSDVTLHTADLQIMEGSGGGLEGVRRQPLK